MTKRSGQRAVKQGGANGAATRITDLTAAARAELRSAQAAEREAAHADATRPNPASTTSQTTTSRSGAPRTAKHEQGEAAAELSRMIAELNEVRMRLDAIVRKLAQSAVELPSTSEAVDDVERLRMRLVGKLDRIRDQLVTRLGEERAPRDR